ncbi:MAG TPA: hypothetical protein VFW00_02320, partial [Rhodocyclaceae bacterium]|nr:hypothetical protein [Rhodocyclaceae bacterium]
MQTGTLRSCALKNPTAPRINKARSLNFDSFNTAQGITDLQEKTLQTLREGLLRRGLPMDGRTR